MKIILTLFTILYSIDFSYSQCLPDTLPPISICNNANLQLDNTGTAVALPSLIGSGSFDNCGIDYMLINGKTQYTFYCNHLGNQIATLTAIDTSGNQSSCLATISILDSIPPIAICNNITVYLDASGIATLLPEQIDNGSSDNCNITSMHIDGQDSIFFNCNNLGLSSVMLTVIDSSGNSNSCSSTVTVTDPSSFCGLSLSNMTINQAEESINISPNPVQQILNITSKESYIQQITLSSITGQVLLIQEKTHSKNTAQLDLRNLPNAIYLLTITTNKGLFTKKIVKT